MATVLVTAAFFLALFYLVVLGAYASVYAVRQYCKWRRR